MADITLQQLIAYYLAIAQRDMDMRGINIPDGDTILAITNLAQANPNPRSSEALSEVIRLLISS